MRLVNLRDVGGLPVEGGGLTRHGVLYRGDAPFDADADPEHVAEWPPATVIDLRSTREVERTPYSWGPDTVVHVRPLHGNAAPANLAEEPDLLGLYTDILDTAAERVAAIVGTVATAHGPILVHCAAGKDRTGVVVAALLLAAGVDAKAVVEDYRRSEENMAALRERWLRTGTHRATDNPIEDGWFLAPHEAIALVVDRLTGWPGGPRGWLVDHGAREADLDAWTARLT